MRRFKFYRISFISLGFLIGCLFFFLPTKPAFTFTETNSKYAKKYYVLLEAEKEFEIRYVHSIHLSDVIEFYEVRENQDIGLLSMTYENLSIGLPGEAGEGESLSLENGIYTLTYQDKVIDSFIIRIGRVDADLAFRYQGNEVDLKAYLKKGKAYEFKVMKLSPYQRMKGEKLNG